MYTRSVEYISLQICVVNYQCSHIKKKHHSIADDFRPIPPKKLFFSINDSTQMRRHG